MRSFIIFVAAVVLLTQASLAQEIGANPAGETISGWSFADHPQPGLEQLTPFERQFREVGGGIFIPSLPLCEMRLRVDYEIYLGRYPALRDQGD